MEVYSLEKGYYTIKIEQEVYAKGLLIYILRNDKLIKYFQISSSPDSDDTYGADEPDEDFSGRDDQFLVSDRTENKFYGTLHGGSSAASTGGVVGSAVGPSLGYIGRRLQSMNLLFQPASEAITYRQGCEEYINFRDMSITNDLQAAATYLCPAIFPWVDTGPATEESGMFVMKMVGVLYILIILFNLIAVFGMDDVNTVNTSFLLFFLFAIISVCLVISRKPQNRNTLMFMTPCLPFIPVVAVTVNIYLILKLSEWTLVRFTIWMILGFIMYFYYGIKNSTLEEDSDDNIELTVTNSEKPKITSSYTEDKNIFSQNDTTYGWNPNTTWSQPSWAQPQAQNDINQPPPARQYQVEQRYNVATNNTQSVINKSNPSTQTTHSDLFVSDPLAFAKWDD
ncbi:hypothetical protein NQ317_010188 [Molorchus minor]|uniref:Cationic amino acid transporter C-terminal domain-containing protein n=1 Tax=Molorchus minor TaxID=1323400 RepID=A0ABQ9JYK9_9CUCU|nr:hypothetical protein NQ317_010188 [Molorchus minor]